MIRLAICFLFLLVLVGRMGAQEDTNTLSHQEVLDTLLEKRKAGDVDGAIEFLSRALDQRADRGGHFGGLYVDVWREAQVRSGRLDQDWAASLYNQLFVSSQKHHMHGEAADVMGNLLGTLNGAGRHGRHKEILDWWAQGQRAAGERLDSSKYRDLGPAVPFLPEVRKREIPESVLYWRVNADKSRPIRKVDLGQKNAQLFDQYADHFGSAGRWAESMEWHYQMLRWASLDDGKPKWQLIQPWFGAVESIADWMHWHGFLEEAVAQVDVGLAAPMQESYHGRCNITLNMTRIDVLMDMERAPTDVVKLAEDLAERAAANRHLGIGTHWMAKVLVAKALIHVGRDAEALAILEEYSKKKFLPARNQRLSYWIEKGMYDRVEEELIFLLNHYRKYGKKSKEAWLYEKYADFLEAVGRLDEALEMRREVIRLYKSFNHFTKLPIELAKLALLLERMGDQEGAKAAAAEARALIAKGRLPKSRLEVALALLENFGKGGDDEEDDEDEPKVDFQPERSIVIPIDGAGWATLLTLTNPSGKAEEGTLSSRGVPLKIAVEGELDEIVIRPSKEGRAGEETFELRLDPKTYELIRITAADKEIEEGEITVVWTSKDGETKVEAAVQVEEVDEGVSSSIIQAGNYRSNPFYSVPMHFHYVSTDKKETTLPMRFVASQQARVEVYALDGTPLSVDAQGNGSLWDRGDELFEGGDGKGNLRMPLNEGAVSFMVLVYPEGPLPEEGLTLNIEIQQDGEWLINSQNRLMP